MGKVTDHLRELISRQVKDYGLVEVPASAWLWIVADANGDGLSDLMDIKYDSVNHAYAISTRLSEIARI